MTLRPEPRAKDAGREPAPLPDNIGAACCGRWAAKRGRFALYCEDAAGATSAWTFWDIQREANRFSNVLAALGVMRGDRVALLLPQRPETAMAHIACYQMGAVAVPLSPRLDAPTLALRLEQAGARVALVAADAVAGLAAVRAQLPGLKHAIGIGGADAAWLRPWAQLQPYAATRYAPQSGAAGDAAALILYADDTAAAAATAVTHAALAEHVRRFLAAHAGYPQAGDLFWSPADWCTPAGLLEALLPVWCCGQPLLACGGGFAAEAAFGLIARYDVRNVRLTAVELAAMMAAVPAPKDRYDCRLRTVATGGAALAAPLATWLGAELGVAGGAREQAGEGIAP
ncbi:MAG: AMP-binding protein [Rhodocyclaceae bacterium]|nr:AMP-binding protein [Rhodocyclaceae bacterium]